jgi:phospholipase C
MPVLDDIDTVVFLMFENRSFDHLLGHLSLENPQSPVEGLRNPDTNPRYANLYEGRVYRPFRIQDEGVLITHDPPHERAPVHTQLAPNAKGTKFRMSGFVKAYVDEYQDLTEHPPPMGYFDSSAAWMTSFLARQYCVCDHWFAPVPAGTHPNRCMAFSGNTLVEQTRTRIIPHREFVFDWLSQRGIRWRVYHDGPPFFMLFGRFGEVVGPHFRPLSELATDVLREPPAQAPQVIFIEPRYFDFFWSNTPASCNHPLARFCSGELFLHRVYSTLVSNPAKWARTMFIVTYDEHGGFFDHVPPLPIVSLVPPGAEYVEDFTSTGPRVPAIVASPRIRQGKVFDGNLDHTSVLQLLAEKFGGGADRYSDSVSARREQGIRSVSEVLDAGFLRQDVPTRKAEICPPLPPAKRAPKAPDELAFELASRMLMQEQGTTAVAKYPDLADLPPPPPAP